MKKVIANINIEIPAPDAKTDEEAELFACKNFKNPPGYVDESFEIVKVIEEEADPIEFSVTLTTTIYAKDRKEALDIFEKEKLDHWNTGENIEVEKINY